MSVWNTWNVMRSSGNPSFAPPPPQNLQGDWTPLRRWIQGGLEAPPRKGVELGSSVLSEAMRSGAFPDEAASMMELFRRAHRTTGHVVLYRGMPQKYLDSDDRSFISCTSAVEVAWRYSRKTSGFDNVVAALLVPPGTPLLSRRGASRDSEYLLLPGRLAVAGPPLRVPLPAVSQHNVRDLFKLPPEKLRYWIDDMREHPQDDWAGYRPRVTLAFPVHYFPDVSRLGAAP